jgi:hypothetical protein
MADEEAWDSRAQLQEFMDSSCSTGIRSVARWRPETFICLYCWRTTKVSLTGTTGLPASCGACLCASIIGRNSSTSEEHGGSLVPIFALAHEHHVDPEMRPYKEPKDQQRRGKLITGMAAGLINIYRYFAPYRRAVARGALADATYRRTTDKVGRNDPCPCGSGKKFKRCCGNSTVH